jgi:hypothetical protein
MPNAPLATTSSRVNVCLSMTTAIRGGVNSTGIDQAAAITLRRAPSALVTSTVGPWLTRRLACASATGRNSEGMVDTPARRSIPLCAGLRGRGAGGADASPVARAERHAAEQLGVERDGDAPARRAGLAPAGHRARIAVAAERTAIDRRRGARRVLPRRLGAAHGDAGARRAIMR